LDDHELVAEDNEMNQMDFYRCPFMCVGSGESGDGEEGGLKNAAFGHHLCRRQVWIDPKR